MVHYGKVSFDLNEMALQLFLVDFMHT